ncbi:hypothetical protein MGYG_04954 [Nannizzia gypsea CBS 118893]|uniref:Uncharacterized protein n=1 Tax=Arthroderma gypseum (strain ATCC MYA-4604 / CBS 118893) TaxID=535722 RepID=E4UXQ8_ARTGP|nr:hypothetical protein MGYG_04954 [Nannizzia gypsea CBS 118893]EFR01953.1 hypothetical protein MGYG_04954 [Nannizzia gypsea CBS 118893]
MPTCPDGLPYHASTGGAAVVGDGKSTITYYPMGAKVSHLASHTTCSIYLPITNPPSKTAKLMRVQVECEGEHGGKITEACIFFGHHHVLTTNMNVHSDFEIFPGVGARLPNSQPFGTNVTFKLSLPNHNSFVNIMSMALGFGDEHHPDYSQHIPSETQVVVSE